jgi:rhodanese-related sulfurtransferase
MPLTATATSLLLQPKFTARAGASSKIEPMRTPVRDVLPDSQEGAWVRVGDGWLTGRAQPESEEELKSWGADVVVSLQFTGEGGGIAQGIVAAAASARALAHHYVCPVRPIWRRDYSDEDCTQLARAVVFIDAHLQRGHKVVVHCRHGKQRTGVAIYLLLRLHGEAQADSLSMMKTMRLKMHELLLRDRRGFFDKTERIFINPAFIWEYAYALTVFCI